MIIYEFKIKAKQSQYRAIDEAIRTSGFIQNKCLRYWMDNKGVGKYELNKHCAVLAAQFPFADELNSMARQAAAERAWSAIALFYNNCKHKGKGKKGYPKFKKHCRSVEYKTSGWKLSENRQVITFSDKKGIGTFKLKGTYELNYYDIKQIKRVRLVRRADGYYAQFAIDAKVRIETEPTGQVVGLDVGLKYLIADDSKGNTEREHLKANCSQTRSLSLYKENPPPLGFKIVRAGGLRLCSRDFQSPGTFAKMRCSPQKPVLSSIANRSFNLIEPIVKNPRSSLKVQSHSQRTTTKLETDMLGNI